MANVSRESYFETGLQVLADLGYGGLKLAEVCNRLGVTTGSFYHYFPNWPAYTRELVQHWMDVETVRFIEQSRAEKDPRKRIDNLFNKGMELPHGAESAIRVWSALDPYVHEVQTAVDQQRYDIMYESAFEILQNKRQAQVFAAWAMYLLVGFEQVAIPRDIDAFRWVVGRMADALDTDGFASVPSGD